MPKLPVIEDRAIEIIKRERGVAHHPVLVAGGIAGVAQVQQFRAESAASRFQQQTIYRRGTAGLLVIELRRHAQDHARGLFVDRSGLRIGQVMGKIGTDDDQRARIAPKQAEHFGDLLGRSVAHRKRHQRESGERLLQERQVHLNGMFVCVRVVADADLRQVPDRCDGVKVQCDFAQRGGKGVGRGQCESAHIGTVGRAEQHHAVIIVAKRRQQRVGVRRDRP
jgi:hypothetical protein